MDAMAWDFIRERYVTVVTVPNFYHGVKVLGIPGHVATVYMNDDDEITVVIDDGQTGELLDVVVDFSGASFEDLLLPEFRRHVFDARNPRPLAIVIENAYNVPAPVPHGHWEIDGGSGGVGPHHGSHYWAEAVVRGGLAMQIAGACQAPVVLTVAFDTDPRPRPWLFAMGEQILRMDGSTSRTFKRFVSAEYYAVSTNIL